MNGYLPGFEPDAAERAQLRFVGGVLDLRQFDKILISVSGGKDSHAMLWLVRDLADRQGVPRDRLLAVYAPTPAWSGTMPVSMYSAFAKPPGWSW